jgi:hypothetical protein
LLLSTHSDVRVKLVRVFTLLKRGRTNHTSPVVTPVPLICARTLAIQVFPRLMLKAANCSSILNRPDAPRRNMALSRIVFADRGRMTGCSEVMRNASPGSCLPTLSERFHLVKVSILESCFMHNGNAIISPKREELLVRAPCFEKKCLTAWLIVGPRLF